MELRHLRYFLAVGREEHFGRAAQALRIAQPALTRQIRDLESELGVELFERLPRGVRLSDAGRVFLAEAEEILAQVDRAVAQTQRFAKGHLGTIRVAISEILATDEFISRCLLHFRESEPGIVLELRSAGAMVQMAAFKTYQLDAAIVYDANIDETEASLLHRAKIGNGRAMLAVHRDHPLAQRASVTMAELQHEPILWPERRLQPGYHDRLLRAWLQTGTMPHIVQECTTTAILLSLVSVGMGAGIVAVTPAVINAAREICYLEISDLDLAFELLLVWRKRDPSPALRRFLKTIQHEASMAETASRKA